MNRLTRAMSSISVQARTTVPLRKGLVNVPGATPSAAALTQRLLQKDFETHHCFFNDKGFHNHLSHHLLSVYDLGGSANLIQSIFDAENAYQRPIIQGPEDKIPTITTENWTSYLGKEITYPAYLKFFNDQIAEHGSQPTIERYIFSPEANGNGTIMLARLVSGVLHPWIQLGFGVEFQQEYLVAMGLALTAMHNPTYPEVLADNPSGDPSTTHTTDKSPTLHDLFDEIYASDTLKPAPYDPNAMFGTRVKQFLSSPSRPATVLDIARRWTFLPTTSSPAAFAADLEHKLKEVIVEATLILGATGLRHDALHRPPRQDFFLMHLLTSALFMQPLLKVAREPVYQARLLQAYLRTMIMTTLARGRPRPDIRALYAHPVALGDEQHDAVPDSAEGAQAALDANGKSVHGRQGRPVNAWPAIIDSATHHSESHVCKAVRSLYFAAQMYETEGALGVVPGVDGTVFVRAATVLIDALGWVSKGEEEREWDRSALGWGEAWAE
ncbi:hypothetical protein BD626DRAFT_624338 [Schizophyllum amplum]|uniref:Oxidoreductase AflY n=1 Tax=Schizophyllum amplum TaxID=97359 RepID=A0A550CVR1_9AGAR|nr:hypothetical protein BD626DRAFT_624338 [Auriculariopsis ampla]